MTHAFKVDKYTRLRSIDNFEVLDAVAIVDSTSGRVVVESPDGKKLEEVMIGGLISLNVPAAFILFRASSVLIQQDSTRFRLRLSSVAHRESFCRSIARFASSVAAYDDNVHASSQNFSNAYFSQPPQTNSLIYSASQSCGDVSSQRSSQNRVPSSQPMQDANDWTSRANLSRIVRRSSDDAENSMTPSLDGAKLLPSTSSQFTAACDNSNGLSPDLYHPLRTRNAAMDNIRRQYVSTTTQQSTQTDGPSFSLADVSDPSVLGSVLKIAYKNAEFMGLVKLCTEVMSDDQDLNAIMGKPLDGDSQA